MNGRISEKSTVKFSGVPNDSKYNAINRKICQLELMSMQTKLAAT